MEDNIYFLKDLMIKRTNTCGELTLNNVDSQVSLNGWISKTRDLGGLIFIDLRDRYGKTQIVFNEEVSKEVFVVSDGSSAYVSTFGRTTNYSEDLISLSADINSGSVRLLGTINNSHSHVIKFVRRIINI